MHLTKEKHVWQGRALSWVVCMRGASLLHAARARAQVSADPLGRALIGRLLLTICACALVESDDARPPLLRPLAAPRQRQRVVVLKVVVKLDIKGSVDLLQRASMRPITHDTGAAQPHPSA